MKTAPTKTAQMTTARMNGSRGPRSRLARFAAPLAAAAALATVTACSSPAPATTQPGATADGSYPVTVTNCGRPLEFAQAPSRVLALAQPQTDLLAELGVLDRVIGQTQTSEPDGLPGSTSADSAGREQQASIPVLSENDIPSREVTLGQEPDLVLAPSVMEFDGSAGHATVEELQAAAVPPYLASGGCPDHRLARSVDDTLTDIENLGRIFGVSGRAAQVAADYRATLDEVDAAVAGRAPVRVAELFVFGDSIEVLAGSSGKDLVRAAGGQNVFAADDPRFGGKLFATLSPEVIAAAEPEAFVFSTGSTESAEKAIALLKQRFPTTPAVLQGRIVAYSSTASLPGSLTLPAAVRAVAEKLHPDVF